jgi:hypothetical protein
VKTSRPPVNRTRRAERVAAWNEAAAEGARYRPRPITGEGAKFEWIRAVQASDLASTTRYVAITLALCGNADGSKIFPGMRTLRDQTALSLHTVSDHVDLLVRRGFLLRSARGGDTAGAKGFEYSLRKPEVFKHVEQWKPVLKHVAHGVQPVGGSVQPGPRSVFNDVAPTRDYQSMTRGGRAR